MPSTPNTLLVMQTIQSKLQALQVDGSTFFSAANVVIGKHKDVTSHVPAAEVTLARDMTARYAVGSGTVQGGRIDDSQEYLIEISLDYSDAVSAETQLAKVRDSLTTAFHTSATLNLQGQVGYSGLTGEGEYGYTARNGQIWRVYRTKLKVRYEYAVIVQP